MDLSRRRGTSGFRFLHAEITEMKRNMEHNGGAIPPRSVFDALAQSFTSSRERAGQIGVLPKQVKTWFHNRHSYRQQPRIVTGKSQANGKVRPLFGDQKHAAGSSLMAQPSAALHTGSAPGTNPTKDTKSSYEAKSAKDGACYDVDTILSQRTLESGDLEVLVHFSGLEAMEDEWVKLHGVRRRSLRCASAECVVVLSGDSVLCLQEGKEPAIYFDAHVVKAHRKRHDIRGCRCTFVVHYEHDHTEETVRLSSLRLRPESVDRLQIILAAANHDALPKEAHDNLIKNIVVSRNG